MWRPNVASVAYSIWMEAANELPGSHFDESTAEAFLKYWETRKCTCEQKTGTVERRFGLSRASTLLHFVSGGKFPILDRRVRAAIQSLTGGLARNTVDWYCYTFCRVFTALAAECHTQDVRRLDNALFEYGKTRPAGLAKETTTNRTKFTCLQCGQSAWAMPGARLLCGNCYKNGVPEICLMVAGSGE